MNLQGEQPKETRFPDNPAKVSGKNGAAEERERKKERVADMLANPDCDMDKGDICEAMQISRDTIYRWLKEPKFICKVAELAERYTDAELGTVYKALIDRCRKGETSAIKLYFEIKMKYKQLVKENEQKELSDDDRELLKSAIELFGAAKARKAEKPIAKNKK